MTRQCVGLLDLALKAKKLKQGDLCSDCLSVYRKFLEGFWRTPINGIAILSYQLRLVAPWEALLLLLHMCGSSAAGSWSSNPIYTRMSLKMIKGPNVMLCCCAAGLSLPDGGSNELISAATFPTLSVAETIWRVKLWIKICLTGKIRKINRKKGAVPDQLPRWLHSSYKLNVLPLLTCKRCTDVISPLQKQHDLVEVPWRRMNCKVPVSWHLPQPCASMSFCHEK